MPVNCCSGRSEEVILYLLGLISDPALDPDLIDCLVPAGKDADAVAARDDLVEVLEKGLPAQAFEDPLPHLVGWLHVQGDPGDRTESAKPDHEAVEIGLASGDLDDLTAGRHKLEASDRGREIAVRLARAVRRRRHGARNRDVGKRSEVVQCHTFFVQRVYQLAVLQSRVEGDRISCMVNDYVHGHGLKRYELRRVGDVVERVTRAQDTHTGCIGDNLLQLLDRRWPVQLVRPVGVIARPVPSWRTILDHRLPPALGVTVCSLIRSQLWIPNLLFTTSNR